MNVPTTSHPRWHDPQVCRSTGPNTVEHRSTGMGVSVQLSAAITAAAALVMVALLLAITAADGPSPVAAGGILVLLASVWETAAAVRGVVREVRNSGGVR